MSNIDKRALRKKLNRRLNDAFGFQRTSGGKHTTISLSIDECKSVLVALDELEAKDKQIDDLKATAAHSNAGWKEAHEQEARAEAAEKRIAEQRETLLAARSYVMQCARLGDAHANGVLQAIDRAAAGKGD